MRIAMFYHSLESDWNHGNAHFLRGVASELLLRGHDLRIYEPEDSWSMQNLRDEHGAAPLRAFACAYPGLNARRYRLNSLDLDRELDGVDLAIVHEWNEHELVRRIGEHRRRSGDYRLLFHDTHHRAVTSPSAMAGYDLSHYDGVLAFGNVLRDLYLKNGWARRAWTWHEAADTRLFRPIAGQKCEGDLVWIGNWGDDERTAELQEFLLEPVKALGLKACVYGVRYPVEARQALADAGIEYRGWLPNFEAPQVFARFRLTVHVPRRPYVRALPGIPTIRVFEALACGVPLICAPWNDAERLFRPGFDYALAQDGAEMRGQLRRLLDDPDAARAQAAHGRYIVLSRHTCAHRVDELINIVADLRAEPYEERHEGTKTRRHGGHSRTVSSPSCLRALVPSCLSGVNTTRAPMNIAFFASSLVSAYWNGAATYYRGIVRALAERGHRITFYEPDAYDRQKHRDIDDPRWAKVVVYSSQGNDHVQRCLDEARDADLIVKASGVGVFDELLESAVLALKRPTNLVAFWDVDAPATLERVRSNPSDSFRPLIPRYDVILTYGGGNPVVEAYESLGARQCVPIYNALDPSTHYPAVPDPRFQADLALLANRLPDREARIEEFFFRAAEALPDSKFLLGGNGWQDKKLPGNVKYVGHVYTRDHNAFNCTPAAVLNVSRESMARFGFSPATRVFEAAGAGSCLLTDQWKGIELFLEPGDEVLMARDGHEVAEHLRSLTPERARRIGQAARRRVLREHTYSHRARELEEVLYGKPGLPEADAALIAEPAGNL